MINKIIKIILALLALVAVYVVWQTQTGKTTEVFVAAHDMPAGYTITAEDIQTQELAVDAIPQGSFTDSKELVGKTLSLPRSAQDVILRSHLGGTDMSLGPDERAIGIEITDSAGLAGLLKPGDIVGINAVLDAPGKQGVFSKVISDGVRVLYVSPDFLAQNPKVEDENGSTIGGGGVDTTRSQEGVIILAVPVGKQVIAYDFSEFGVQSDTLTVNMIELLSAFDNSRNVELSLFMTPSNRQEFLTSGVYIPDLVISPQTPTPTLSPDEQLTPVPNEGG